MDSGRRPRRRSPGHGGSARPRSTGRGRSRSTAASRARLRRALPSAESDRSRYGYLAREGDGPALRDWRSRLSCLSCPSCPSCLRRPPRRSRDPGCTWSSNRPVVVVQSDARRRSKASGTRSHPGQPRARVRRTPALIPGGLAVARGRPSPLRRSWPSRVPTGIPRTYYLLVLPDARHAERPGYDPG